MKRGLFVSIRTVTACLAPIALLLGAAIDARAADQVRGADLHALVSGRSWGISFWGNFRAPTLTNVWDFKKDGSVCARNAASKRGDKCADNGKWTVRADQELCWDLTWMGEVYKIKSVCAAVQKWTRPRTPWKLKRGLSNSWPSSSSTKMFVGPAEDQGTGGAIRSVAAEGKWGRPKTGPPFSIA